MAAKVRRHPVLGFFAGLLLGIGIALLLFVFGVTPVTLQMLGIIAGAGAVLGIVAAYVAPVRGKPSSGS